MEALLKTCTENKASQKRQEFGMQVASTMLHTGVNIA
jgi:hypothetical protein